MPSQELGSSENTIVDTTTELPVTSDLRLIIDDPLFPVLNFSILLTAFRKLSVLQAKITGVKIGFIKLNS